MRALLVIAALASVAHAGPTGRVVGTVKVTESNGKPASGADVIVYVVGVAEPRTAGPKVTVEQKGRKFVPDLIAVTVGDTVSFPNKDAFLHNVFSQSGTRKFDLGSFKKGDTKDKEFPTPGVVDVYCNIHPEMAATVLVLPNRRFARVGDDGRFTIAGVPPGRWTAFAYVRLAVRPGTAPVIVDAGAATTVELEVTRGPEVEHRNKYHEHYREPGVYR